MAYITGSETYVATDVSSYAVSIPPTATGDVVLMVICGYQAVSISSVVGDNAGTWTQEVDFSASADDMYIYSCVQAATPDTVVTVTYGASENTIISIMNCKGVDTTTPIETYATSAASSGRDVTMPSIITSNNKSIIWRTCGARGYPTYPKEGNFVRGVEETRSQLIHLMSATEIQLTSGATGTQTWYNLNGYAAGNSYITVITMAIKDDGTGDIEPGLDSTVAPYEYLLTMAKNDGGFIKGAPYDPTDVANEHLSSLSNGGYTNSNLHYRVNSYTSGALKPGFRSVYSDVTSTYKDNVILTGYPITEVYNTSDNYDLSGKLLCLSNKGADPRIHPDSDIGSCIAISDQTNARFWQLGTTNSAPSLNDGVYPTVIDVDDASYVMEDIATPNTSDIGAIIIGSEPSAYYVAVWFGPLYMLGTLKLHGGSSTVPGSFESFNAHVKSKVLNTVLAQGGLAVGQYFVCQDTQCGGAGAVYWDCSNQSAEWPSAYDSDNKKRNFKMGAGVLTHTIGAVAGSTVIYDSTTLNFGNFHNFILDSAVAISSEGLTILNADPVLKNNASAALTGVSFIGCKEITYTTLVDMSGGNTVSNCVDTTSITVTSEADFAKLANCTFTGNNRAITITGNQSHTGAGWADPSLTVSGNTYDIEYTGTTNFSIQSAATLSVNNASSGVCTVVTPVTAFTINSSEASSDIKIFTTSTQTVLSSVTSNTDSYTYTGTPTFDWTVMKAGFLPQRGTGVLMAGANVTVEVTLVADAVYDSGHGLTYTTDASWSRALNELTVPTFGPSVRAVHSLMIENFISQSALDNTAYNISMNGPNSMFLIEDAEGATDASIENMTAGGCRYLSSSDVVTAEWCGIESIGTATGFQGEYQQQDGSGTTDARATGKFDEIVKMYGDVTHDNFDYRSHLVLKFQPNGYREERVDVPDTYGVATLEPTHYIIAMEPVAIAAATGDPAVTITVTDHGASPVTWNSKDWSITVLDSGAVTGEEIIRELNYNLAQDATYEGKDPFNWPEMVLEAGDAYETAVGYTEGGVPTDGLKGVRVLRGANAHPDFTRMQADDESYYVVPVTANASITSIVTGSRVRIYNETTATETYNDVPGTSFSDSYTEGTTYTSGDVISIYIAQISTVTAQAEYSTSAIASSTGWTVIAAQVSDDVYDTNGIDGSTLTSKFTADYVNDEIDFATASNFTGPEIYAFYMYTLTTASGIENFFGGITALDAGNYRNNNSVVSMKLDNTTTTEVWQTDSSRIFRVDEARPIRNPTSGGGGIDVNWKNVVYVVTAGSGLDAGQQAELTAAAATSTFDPTVDVVEGSETYQEALRLIRAEAAGKLAVAGTTVTIRDAADTKDRITATVDSNGQRTAVTTDVT